MTKQTDKPTGLALLREPFPAHQISKLPKPTKKQTEALQNDFKAGVRCELCHGWHHPQVQHLDYVGHAALTDRLLDADPDWFWEPVAFGQDGLPAFDQSGGLWIRLTVCQKSRLGYGHAERKSLDKTGGDRIKEVIGDALRNAAMRFGAALDLWHKGDLHVDEGGEGQSDDREVNPPADTPPAKPAPWREPESMYSTPTALHKALAGLERELMGCGDSDMVYALCGTPEWREFARVAELHAPHYLRGGEPAPPEFKGLLNIAETMVREFDSGTANHMTELAGV